MAEIIKFKHSGVNSRGAYDYRIERAKSYRENKKIENALELIAELSPEIGRRKLLDGLTDESLLNQWTEVEPQQKLVQIYASIDQYIEQQLGYKTDEDNQ